MAVRREEGWMDGWSRVGVVGWTSRDGWVSGYISKWQDADCGAKVATWAAVSMLSSEEARLEIGQAEEKKGKTSK